MIRSLAILVTLLVGAGLLVAEPADAQARKKPARRAAPVRKPAPKPEPTKVLVEMTFANVFQGDETLHAQCRSQRWPGLLWGLDGVFGDREIVKGEFETSEAFTARKAGLEKALSGGEGDRLVVCVPIGGDSATFTYDADAETWRASIEQDALVEIFEKKTGTYRSRTAMGARATVTAWTAIEYRVDMSQYLGRNGCLEKGYGRSTFAFPMPRVEAPSLKADGYVAFIGHLRAPFLARSERSGEPTLSDPVDYSTLVLKAHFEPEEIKVVGPAGIAFTCQLGAGASGTAAIPATPVSSWVTADDYPPLARSLSQEGTTDFQLDVDATGRVTGCSVTSSSGAPALDQATCTLLTRRGRFLPARDAQGRATSASFSSRFRWSLRK